MGINSLSGIAALSSLTPDLPGARGMRLLIVYIHAPVYPQAVLLAPAFCGLHYQYTIIQLNEQPLQVQSICRQ